AAGLPASAVPLVLERTGDESLSNDVRAQLIRLLRGERSAAVVERLIRLAAPGKSLLGRPRLAAATPVTRAAVATLAALRPVEERARQVLELAAVSDDPDLRAAARTTP